MLCGRGNRAWVTVLVLCCALAATTARVEAVERSERTVRVGVFDNRPIVFREPDGSFAGIAIDVIEAIAREEGWRIQYVYGAWDDVLNDLEAGQIDVLVGIAYSEQRAKRFRFSRENLIGNWGVVYASRRATIVSPLDLRDRRVAVMRRSIHTDEFQRLMRQFGVPFVPVEMDDYADVLKAIEHGNADAGVVNRIYGVLNAGRDRVAETGIVFNPIYIHYAAPLAAGDGLLARIDARLHDLKAEKRSIYYRSLERWLESPPVAGVPRWLSMAVIGLVAALMLVVLLVTIMRRQVRLRTRELHETSAELEREVDRRRAAQERLKQLAYYDSLTGLPNREAFAEHIQLAIDAADRSGARVAVMFVDLDRLKTINDSLGHNVGDVLLNAVGMRLAACLRSHDQIHRFGGDEFVVTLGDIHDSPDAVRVAERLLASLSGPIDVGPTAVYISASVGITLYPDDERSVDGLLKNADTAMYHAKEQGGNCYQFYNREQTARVVNRLSNETRLRHALERGELYLHYQPVIDLASGAAVGAEALLRWQDPDRGMIPPDQFIPHAEESGLIVPIGEWVLERACTQMRAWNVRHERALRVAVNVSGRQFQSGKLVESVARALRHADLAPDLLELEITEGVLLVMSPEVRQALEGLRDLGVHLAIDDFGTGYSSLSYLKQLPIGVLKIDRSFVRGIPDNKDDIQIASTIVTMAHGLGREVVAEGIETAAQRDLLRARGCRYGQGYLFARPLPASDFEAWLSEEPTRVARG